MRSIRSTPLITFLAAICSLSAYTSSSCIGGELLKLNEETSYSDGLVQVHLENTEGRPEAYFTSDQFPDITVRMTSCYIRAKKYEFSVGITIEQSADVGMLLAKIRTAPQSVSTPVELCLDEKCSLKRLEYDEYFGGVATQASLKLNAAKELQTLAILFADSRQEAIKLDFDFSQVLGRICSSE